MIGEILWTLGSYPPFPSQRGLQTSSQSENLRWLIHAIMFIAQGLARITGH